MPWLYLLCVVMIAAYFLQWLGMRRNRKLLAGLPSYPELPILGSLLEIMVDARKLFLFLNDVSIKAENAMKPLVFRILGVTFLFMSDPDDVRTVTSTFIEKPYFYKFGKSWLGDGLVTASTAIWKKNIKKLGGAFNVPIVEDYQMIFNAQGEKLVEKLKGKVGAEPFDVMDILAYTTFETICQTALGEDDITKMVTVEYYEAFNRAISLLLKRGVNFFIHPECIYKLTAQHAEYMSCVEVVREVSHKVLKKKVLERQLKQNEQMYSDKVRRFKPFIDILLDMAADTELSEEYIKSEINTIIVGGQETTATTMFFTLLMLGCEPEVQSKLSDEIKSIFGDSTRPVETEDLKRMHYCEAVIHETLRLFPPVPGVLRLADRDLQLKSCTVPRGTVCCINAWGAGRSQRSWGPDALEFRPERWLNTSHDSAAFLPFSYGRRSCIGKKYAISVLKTLLTYCVRELTFSSEAHKLDFKLDIALRAVSGHLMEIKLRD